MGVSEIEAKIRAAGKKEAEAISKEADASIALFEGEVKSEADAVITEVARSRSKGVEQVSKRIRAATRLSAQETVESAKNRLIDEAFDKAKKTVLEASEADKKKYLKALADEGLKQIPGAVVYVDPAYAHLIKAEKRALSDFGVVVESKDGVVRIDNTLTAYLARVKQAQKAEIAKTLFT
ncbi:V-type ATP synthase subunit E [uncultured archaeon]|nr:V-type ATP synthase subunit E [uncultured archaeon]